MVFLATFHGINLTLRHLHRLLREQNLFRRYHFTNLNDIVEVIQKEMLGSGENFGYRTMHQKLRMKGVVTNRETVRLIIKTLDPLGVGLKKSHKLKRCMYTSRGPNFLWHVDGYDKLKSFGFPIHGCIDGYSRKILWLNVSPTNNDPQVMATSSLSVDPQSLIGLYRASGSIRPWVRKHNPWWNTKVFTS